LRFTLDHHPHNPEKGTSLSSEADRLAWRIHGRKWRAANPERAKEISRDWYHRNKDKVAEARKLKREVRADRKVAAHV
jgi:hypothetical protein